MCSVLDEKENKKINIFYSILFYSTLYIMIVQSCDSKNWSWVPNLKVLALNAMNDLSDDSCLSTNVLYQHSYS